LKLKQQIKIKKKFVFKFIDSGISKKDFCFYFSKILPILVLCNEIISDERRSSLIQTDAEQWTAKDKCFG
jgi:hypothetical protein